MFRFVSARHASHAILPSATDHLADDYLDKRGGTRVGDGFAYNSGTNPDFLTVDQLRQLIVQHVDPSHRV